MVQRFKISRSYDELLIEDLHRQIFPADEIEIGDDQWLITQDGKNIGFCASRYLRAESAVFLLRTGIFDKHRGRGMQRRSIKIRERQARVLGKKWSITYVLNTNYPSMTNLIKEGYKFYNPEYAWAGRKDIYYMRKQL